MVKQLEREAQRAQRTILSVQRGAILQRIVTIARMHAMAAKTYALSGWKLNFHLEMELMGTVNGNMQLHVVNKFAAVVLLTRTMFELRIHRPSRAVLNVWRIRCVQMNARESVR